MLELMPIIYKVSKELNNRGLYRGAPSRENEDVSQFARRASL